jgi:hypothetical protein
MVSVGVFVASQICPTAAFQARPEMLKSGALHWLSTAPGVACEKPATW